MYFKNIFIINIDQERKPNADPLHIVIQDKAVKTNILACFAFLIYCSEGNTIVILICLQ